MNKYISYSLWGDSRLYLEGCLTNVELAKTLFPDFQVVVFCASDCPALHVLKKTTARVFIMPPTKGIDRNDEKWKWEKSHTSMFWRNYLIDLVDNGDVILFRDADSRLSTREVGPVNQWIESDYLAMRFVECEAHLNSFFMGGLFAVKVHPAIRGITESIAKWIDFYPQLNHDWIFIDLLYYTNILGPVLKNSTMSFGWNQPFPLPPCKQEETIGWVVDDHLRNEVFCEY